MRRKETSNVRESELGRETRDLHGALGAAHRDGVQRPRCHGRKSAGAVRLAQTR